MMKVLVLGALVLNVGAASLWMKNVGQPYWWSPLLAMLAAVGLLSSLLLGDKNTVFREVASGLDAIIFADQFRSLVTLGLLIVSFGFLSWRASTTIPPSSDYFVASVYRDQPLPDRFAVGAEVVLFSVTDGAAWTSTVTENGIAQMKGFTIPTIARVNISEDRDGARWSWASPQFEIPKLPRGEDYDLAEIPEDDWISRPLPTTVPARTRVARASVAPQVDMVGDASLQRVNAPWGVPKAGFVVNRYSYILGVDRDRRIPLWTAYAVAEAAGPTPRNRRFRLDPAVPADMQASTDEYRTSGFDRGHLVSPRDVLYKGEVAVMEASYLTTLTPQVPAVNRRIWNDLEQATRAVADRLDREVYVVNGPLFDEGAQTRTIGDQGLPVPDHFFRVVAWLDERQTLAAAAYIIPNQPDMRAAPFEDFLVTINDVEQRSGLSILPDYDGPASLKSGIEPLPMAE